MKNGDSFPVRSGFLLVCILSAAFLCIASMLCNGILHRDDFLEECRRIAWKTGTIPAIRGRILDKQGNVLACTKICYGLRFSSVPEDPERVRRILRKVSRCLGKESGSIYPDRGIILENLSPEECRLSKELLKSCPELRLFPQFKRVYAEKHPHTGSLGEIRSPEEGVTVGVSGMEAKYDSVLAGTPGRFAVMLDRRGEWVPGTVRIIYEPIHGNDAAADFEKEEFAP